MAFSPNRVEVREKVEKVSAQRMRLWHALHDFVRQHGGAVVSVPGHREIRIEVPKDSPLAAKLSEAGYQPHHHCATTRIAAGAFTTVDVISIMMPGK
jgi:hypothetical protein